MDAEVNKEEAGLPLVFPCAFFPLWQSSPLARNMGLPLDSSLFLTPHNEVWIHECPYFYFLDCAHISTASALFSPPTPPAPAQFRSSHLLLGICQ